MFNCHYCGTVVALVALVALLAVAGCGSDSGSSASTGAKSSIGNMTRPQPGMVEQIDSLNDITADDPQQKSAPTFLDINRASIKKAGNRFTFNMELAAVLPAGPQPGSAVEWGFLLDVDQDGTPDWGIFADLTTKDGWVPGVYNEKTKERITGARFPGTFTHEGTTLAMDIDGAAIGSPEAFKWFAFSDAALTAGGATYRAGDRVWEPSVPGDSKDWLPFP